jgi:putative PIN family toxin of toxin-antitoxin system
LDTNLLVSAVIGSGPPRQLLQAAQAGTFEFCTSEALLAELLDVLARPKFATRLAAADLSARDVVADLRLIATVVRPTDTPRVVPTDPDDDHVVAAALTCRADLIVSGDKRDLLALRSVQGIFIVNARDALDRLATGGLV